METIWFLVKIGEAVVTGAGNLKNAKYIIHAVLPVWRGGNEQEVEQLNEAVRNTLVVADEKNVKSIAFPALGGTGVYGFPKEVATKGLVLTCLEYTKNKNPNKTVINIKFMNADQAITKFFQESVETLLSQPNFEEKRVAEEHCLAEQQRRAEQKAREEAKEHRLAEEKRIAEDLETARLLEKNKSSKQPQPNTNKSGENMHAGAHPQEESKHQPLIRNKYIASR